ncbi:hypothetical protein Pla100_03040 [Neorhodopirellula pilleata]|uniref:Uncharacterized protein n=1 Tax=Neorhodopirellula pilleata TaxID=2714738 RepID=A0A5C6ATL7_9BACT|nr:hypothetical protein Pla100_03040 [Neorhodopirellula pilleata]
MLLRCSTATTPSPSTSVLLVVFLPVLRSRRIVASLFPNASKKAYGNSAASNAASISLLTASSISTAFKRPILRANGWGKIDDAKVSRCVACELLQM